VEDHVSPAVILDPFSERPTDPNADQVIEPYYQQAGRHTKLAVTWESKGIARDLAPHLKALSYGDNLSGAADDLALELEDRVELWSGDWRPQFGDTVVARIEADGWFSDEPTTSLRLGTFAHDKIGLKGPPHVASLQCVSAPLATGLRRRKRTHAWRGVTLKQIATDIANRANLRLDFQANSGPAYKSAVQNDKSDLEFLQEECKEIGATLKVTEKTIVIYDELALDSGPSIGTIDLRGGQVLDWAFDADDSGRYGFCHVTCFDPRTGKKYQYQFPPDGTTIAGLDPNGQTLELVIQVSDVAEAQTRATALLRNANRFATSGKLTTVGDCGLVAGVIFDLTNAGGFNGKFIITKAEHHPVGGYVCNLDVRRCLEGY
jgi:Bacteriophage probable baseplate hub protein